jgi:hypothetical protein
VSQTGTGKCMRRQSRGNSGVESISSGMKGGFNWGTSGVDGERIEGLRLLSWWKIESGNGCVALLQLRREDALVTQVLPCASG